MRPSGDSCATVVDSQSCSLDGSPVTSIRMPDLLTDSYWLYYSKIARLWLKMRSRVRDGGYTPILGGVGRWSVPRWLLWHHSEDLFRRGQSLCVCGFKPQLDVRFYGLDCIHPYSLWVCVCIQSLMWFMAVYRRSHTFGLRPEWKVRRSKDPGVSSWRCRTNCILLLHLPESRAVWCSTLW